MTLDQMLKLIDAGFSKDEILKMAAPEQKPEQKQEQKPEQKQRQDTDPESEVTFLRKQVQELQKINLAFASGVAPAPKTESIDDIMTTLLNGKAPAK